MDDNGDVSACEHLLANPESDYYWYFTGKGSESFLLCEACRKDVTHKGVKLNVRRIRLDELKLINQEGYLDGVSGEVTVQECPVSHLPPVRFIELPGTPVLTMTALPDRRWLLYSASHELAVFDPDTGVRKTLMSVSLPEETDEAWCNRHLTPRLHCDPSGHFAALVHDYGRYGIVVDLLGKRITMTLDGGDYHPETVPFSLSFIIHNERPVIIHRTAWNRLDASDPETGRLLTARGPTDDQSGEDNQRMFSIIFTAAFISHHQVPGCSMMAGYGVPLACLRISNQRIGFLVTSGKLKIKSGRKISPPAGRLGYWH